MLPTEKRCTICKTVKPAAAFYVIPSRGLLHPRCRDCNKAYSKAWRSRNPGKHTEHRQKYRATEKGRSGRKSELKRWRSRNPEKHKAHLAVLAAQKRGDLVSRPCEVCGDPKSEGHHDDYGRPLDVRWLCKQHHVDLHNGRLNATEV